MVLATALRARPYASVAGPLSSATNHSVKQAPCRSSLFLQVGPGPEGPRVAERPTALRHVLQHISQVESLDGSDLEIVDEDAQGDAREAADVNTAVHDCLENGKGPLDAHNTGISDGLDSPATQAKPEDITVSSDDPRADHTYLQVRCIHGS